MAGEASEGSEGAGDTRLLFLKAIDASRPVLAAPETAGRWEGPSALADLTVRGLAGHLVRAAVVVERYLHPPEPLDELPIAPARYYLTLVTTSDVGAPENVEVRRRGEEMAAEGHEALVRRFDETRGLLEKRFQEEPRDRKLRVAGDLVMLLDDYLLTRIVEVVVHTDDLAVSVGVDTPLFGAAVMDAALAHLVDVARTRHGDLHVLRALCRRERDEVEALRVF